MKPVPDSLVVEWLEENNDDSVLSVIVLAELARGIEALDNGKRKAALGRKLHFLQEDYADQTAVFDEVCAWEWARYIRQTKDAGFFPPLLDSQIAATARAWGLKVVTRNEADFPLTEVVNPFKS